MRLLAPCSAQPSNKHAYAYAYTQGHLYELGFTKGVAALVQAALVQAALVQAA